jgi:hypothetical protein
MDIIDSRTVLDFQKFTFSGHLRNHVYRVLDENIKLGHADYACYWTLELMCSGLVHSYWNTIFLSSALHINRAAPNVFLYLVRMYERFAPYEGQYSVQYMTDIRNNADARHLLCEVSASVSLCKKSKLPPLPRIKPDHDFSQPVIQENLKSPSSMHARPIMKQEDPMELYIPTNELMYCLSSGTRDSIRALYWSSWILAYAAKYKIDRKEYLTCAYRSNDYVEEQYLRSPVWILWACVMESVRTSPQTGVLSPYIDALYKMYCLRWAKGDLKKRIPFLITAIIFVCESNTLDIHYAVPQNIAVVQDIITNIPQWISAIIQTQKTFS